ncbi:putative cysteine desulfurase IscS 1 [Lactococcus piscium]|jgi:cysteine desulfurase|uniref:cysteine desulfurase n=2 Tax=Streptococcaceae TaxID=1300 RepID=A0A0D6DV28_9LACT|nr:Putative cysteine desulfurase IscS [Lactococcus piscium MKFS47]SOB47104.1 putative cysteine desulfurase IscS 1 [Lactococcus piscium]
MFDVATDTFGNPSSIHRAGRAAAKIIRQSRDDIAAILAIPSRQLIFTSGGSEANNQAIIGYALANQHKGKHLITTAIEHHSVLHAFVYLKDKHGFDITIVKPNAAGILTADSILAELRDDTILVSTMYANNETGQILPIADIAKGVRAHQAVYHVDAVQVIGKLPIHPSELGIDLLTAAAHKFHGPKGVGFLYQNNLVIDPLIHGGEQEEKRRAGTENIVGIVGMAKALSIAHQRMAENDAKVAELNTYFLSKLDGFNFYLNQFGELNMPHIINLGFPGMNQDLLLMKLDLQGVAISTGSACTAGDIAPSHVLTAIYGSDSAKLKESVRVSFSELNTLAELTEFVNILTSILSRN